MATISLPLSITDILIIFYFDYINSMPKADEKLIQGIRIEYK